MLRFFGFVILVGFSILGLRVHADHLDEKIGAEFQVGQLMPLTTGQDVEAFYEITEATPSSFLTPQVNMKGILVFEVPDGKQFTSASIGSPIVVSWQNIDGSEGETWWFDQRELMIGVDYPRHWNIYKDFIGVRAERQIELD